MGLRVEDGAPNIRGEDGTPNIRAEDGTPDIRPFSLTLDSDSGILDSLRGVAPEVCVEMPGPLVDAPYGGRLEQASGC
jgi:hypothetical protein